ncbi:MAG: SWIM zinc finger family protein [Cyanobacteria bacterium J06648_11]
MLHATAVNKSAAARIFDVAPSAIARLERWANCAFVVVKGIGARFVSYTDFARDFVASRQARAAQLNVFVLSAEDRTYTVTGGSETHTVCTASAFDGCPTCTCEDYQRHRNETLFDCKHMIAAFRFEDAQPKPRFTPTAEDLAEQVEIEREIWEAEVQAERIDLTRFHRQPTVVCGVSID